MATNHAPILAVILIVVMTIVVSALGAFILVFFPKKVHVYIKNELDGETWTNIHCKSKDDDLLQRILAPNQTYDFKFRTDIFGRTKFVCRIWFIDSANHVKDITLDVYSDSGIPSDCEEFPWEKLKCHRYIRSDGLYFVYPELYPRLGLKEFQFPWPKPRRRLEADTKSESCKHCNCKKSKCLKLYCECFAAGVYCVEPCSCQNCFDKPTHEDSVLATRKQMDQSRNPLARFAPKVIMANESTWNAPASARRKRGCSCKKSSCLKKYLECYQGGVGCSINCRWEGCKNAFGRKDGTMPTGAEEADRAR